MQSVVLVWMPEAFTFAVNVDGFIQRIQFQHVFVPFATRILHFDGHLFTPSPLSRSLLPSQSLSVVFEIYLMWKWLSLCMFSAIYFGLSLHNSSFFYYFTKRRWLISNRWYDGGKPEENLLDGNVVPVCERSWLLGVQNWHSTYVALLMRHRHTITRISSFRWWAFSRRDKRSYLRFIYFRPENRWDSCDAWIAHTNTDSGKWGP